jgi:signal transduction histidine kinase
MIESILNLSRIESQKVSLQLQSKDINTILRGVVEKCGFLAQEKNIQIITEFEPMFSVKVDEGLLTQVFTNLIENAIKYSPNDTKILISTEEVNGKIRVQVADQGFGIPSKDINNVFEKFYRSSDSNSVKIKGTGLGLYLTKYFVNLHKGEISAESEPGQGSTFTVELPMNLDKIKEKGVKHV